MPINVNSTVKGDTLPLLGREIALVGALLEQPCYQLHSPSRISSHVHPR
jgi:hypothetical protein